MDVARAGVASRPRQERATPMRRLDYESLASLPLFLGIDGATLSELYSASNPVVASMRRGSVLISAGEECRAFVYLLEGELEACADFGGGRFQIHERVAPTAIIEPQCLFGLHNTYTRTYTATASGLYMRLPKNVVVGKMMGNDVFRFNLLNMLSSQVQDGTRRLRHLSRDTIASRMADFIARQTLRPVGRKTVRCKMTDLAEQLGETRLNVSRTLHSLQDAGLLAITRNTIEIPAMEKLVAKAD